MKGDFAIAVRWVAAFGVVFLIALALDRPVAQANRTHPLVDKHRPLTHRVLETIKLPGWFPVTLSIAVLLGIFHRGRWWAAACLAGCGVAVGAAYSVLKWVVGRHRPDQGASPFDLHPFAQGLAGIWREKALCFPSGHASLAFASAMCLSMLIPRGKWIFFAVACCTAIERVVENAHYPSDVVAGAALGSLLGWWITRLMLRDEPPIAPATPEHDSATRELQSAAPEFRSAAPTSEADAADASRNLPAGS